MLWKRTFSDLILEFGEALNLTKWIWGDYVKMLSANINLIKKCVGVLWLWLWCTKSYIVLNEIAESKELKIIKC